MLIKKYETFFAKRNIADKEMIKNKGIRNITCLNSSYKFTFNKINRKIINKVDTIIGATNKVLWVKWKKIFSLKIKKIIPKIMMTGNLKKNHIGKYDEGKFCAFMHSPKVTVQTVWMCWLIDFNPFTTSNGLSQ